MSNPKTVWIGQSWYVIENISGVVAAEGNEKAKMLMAGGQVVDMPGASPDLITTLRLLREGEIAAATVVPASMPVTANVISHEPRPEDAATEIVEDDGA